MTLDTTAETAIRNAMAAVEAAGCDPLLTDAVNLLQRAKDKVSDFVLNLEDMADLEDFRRDDQEKKAKAIKCAQCGSTAVVFESAAEGYWCQKCGASDSDE